MKKKLTLLFALLCVSVMGWATDQNTDIGVAGGCEAYAGKIKWKAINDVATPANVDNIQLSEGIPSVYVTFVDAAFNEVTGCEWDNHVNGACIWVHLPLESMYTDIYVKNNGTVRWGFTLYNKDGIDDREFNASDLTITSSVNLSLTVGETSDITKTTSSSGAITYTSSHPSVATVDSEGHITAVAGGTTTITVKQAIDVTNQYKAGLQTIVVTVPRSSECSGDLGYFNTPETKRISYTIEYLPISDKIRYTVTGYNTEVLDYLEIHTTSGNSGALSITNGVATWLQIAPASGTEMAIRFLYSTASMGGNEQNSQNVSLDDPQCVYYKSHDCEVEEAAAPVPTTAPANDESRELCQVQGILGTTKYPAPGFTRYEPTWGGSTHEVISLSGKSVDHIMSGSGFAGGIGDKDIRDFTHVQFDVWCAETKTFGLQIVCWNGGWQYGTKKNFTTTAEEWKTVSIPLSEFEHSSADLATSVLLYFQDLNNTQFYITNIYYYTNSVICASEPDEAPEVTLQKACQVYSLYSDYNYPEQATKLNNALWCGGTAEDVMIAGKKVKKLSGSSGCYGFEKSGGYTTTINVSEYDYMHVDVWVPQTTTIQFDPINRNGTGDGNEPEQHVDRTITSVGTWQSIDIPVSEFKAKGLSMERVWQFRFDGLSGGKKMWFTNLYFYKTADCTPDYSTWNLALNKPAYAGKEVVGSEIYRANDGDITQRWATGEWPDISTQWWYVDLGDKYDLTRIEISFENAYPQKYLLQVATEDPAGDESKWTNVYATAEAGEEPGHSNVGETAEANKNIYDVTGNVGRYVRIKSSQNSLGGQWGFSMWEFRVFASGIAAADANAPVMESATIYSNPVWSSVTLTLTATDVEGEVNKFRVNDGRGNTFVVNTDAEHHATISDLEMGKYTFTIEAIDGAANISENSIDVNVEIFNPSANLAFSKEAEAGFYENPGEKPEFANDNNLGTPWTTWSSSGKRPMSEQWWSVDLGDVYQLSAVELFWADKSDHYLIQVAHSEPTDKSDDSQWYTVLEVEEPQNTGNAEENVNHYALNASARYVRMKALTMQGNYLKLWEFRVFGSAYATEDTNAPEITTASVTYGEGNAYLTLQATDTEDGAIKTFRVVNTTTGEKALYTTDGEDKIVIAGLDINTPYEFEIQAMDKAANLSAISPMTVRLPATAGNLALGKTCYAGYEWTNEGEKKEKANDGDTGTNWVTYGGEGNRDGWWWYVDLGSLYHLTSVELYWPDVYFSNNYKIQVRREAPSEEQKADDNAWTTVATVTDAAAEAAKTSEVDVVARYVRVKILNTGWIKLAEVRVFGDAVVVALDDQVDNTATIAANDETQANVEFNRTFDYANEWYTICLPFDMTNAQLVDAFGAGYTLAELVGSDDRGSIIHINFDYVRALVAGKAYLVKVASPITEAPTFRNVTIKDVNPASLKSTCPHMEFQGTFAAFTLEGENKRFVGEENYLYAPNPDGGTPMGAFRCYFTIPDGSSAGAPGRTARLNFAPEQTTEIGNVGEQATPSKYILNGVLYIIRDGRTYNAQGMLVQ